MVKAILPPPNQKPVCIQVDVDDLYTARFWTHHFEVQLDQVVQRFMIWLKSELDETDGFIWADSIQQAEH
jgi:hypothetical protein